ncbi:MAG: UDP-N-acetylmuramate--L-alanine ligase [Paludibacteraceae bacterium]|nr:UDP-N-acetylmuramate--L-alanine ligase [Paludibacteraceae bacterium]
MSALARYFKSRGFHVAGYDRTTSVLSKDLENEGIYVTYDDAQTAIPDTYLDKLHTLVVYTPAIHSEHPQLSWFRQQGFSIEKRAEVLGRVTQQLRSLCVAGTHGKTTTSTILAHLLYQSEIGCNAFLGGISNNYDTNLLLNKESNLVVIEADEYDRSFHHLTPYMAVVTSIDPDHLDVYGDATGYMEGFAHFAGLVHHGGVLLVHEGINFHPTLQKGVRYCTYSGNKVADFYADNIKIGDGRITFDFHTPTEIISDMRLGAPVKINIDNSVAAMAIAWLNGVTSNELRLGLSSYSGVYRRFNTLVRTNDYVLIDDYAHHPTELHASIDSVRALYPSKRIVGVFQPHLYTRTRDFAKDFARELSCLDSLIMLPIYPAREQPIDGVNSELILSQCTCPEKRICQKKDLIPLLLEQRGSVILTLGAGDIDRLVPQIAEALRKNES